MNGRRGWHEGSAAVEGAIALTFLIPIILGIVEFGIAFYSTNTMQLVIEEAGRYAMINSARAIVFTVGTVLSPALVQPESFKLALPANSTCWTTSNRQLLLPILGVP